MPEINQYVFSNKELLELLIKQAGVREGRWVLMTNFGIMPGNFGSAVEQAAQQIAPGVAVVINEMGIQRATAEMPEQMSVDAALLYSPTSKRTKTS